MLFRKQRRSLLFYVEGKVIVAVAAVAAAGLAVILGGTSELGNFIRAVLELARFWP